MRRRAFGDDYAVSKCVSDGETPEACFPLMSQPSEARAAWDSIPGGVKAEAITGLAVKAAVVVGVLWFLFRR